MFFCLLPAKCCFSLVPSCEKQGCEGLSEKSYLYGILDTESWFTLDSISVGVGIRLMEMTEWIRWCSIQQSSVPPGDWGILMTSEDIFEQMALLGLWVLPSRLEQVPDKMGS